MAYVYRFLNKNKDIIYIGYTGNSLKKRIDLHFIKGHLPQDCYSSISEIEYLQFNTNSDAIIVETYMINKYKPRYNKLNKKDDAVTLNIPIEENWKLYKKIFNTKVNSRISINNSLMKDIIIFIIFIILLYLSIF